MPVWLMVAVILLVVCSILRCFVWLVGGRCGCFAGVSLGVVGMSWWLGL